MKSLSHKLFSILFLLVCMFLLGCNSTKEKKKQIQKEKKIKRIIENNKRNVVKVLSYDFMRDIIFESKGVMINPKQILTLVPPRNKIYYLSIEQKDKYGRLRKYRVEGYSAIDLNRGLLILDLQASNGNFNEIKFSDSSEDYIPSSDTILNVSIEEQNGSPYYNEKYELAGLKMMNNNQISYIPIRQFRTLIDSSAKNNLKHISSLKTEGNIYPPIDKVVGFELQTSMGKIRIRLYDDLPVYKKNFIKLAVEKYYDSLLVHRVIPNFLVQTGSPDSREADSGSYIGRMGPGYNLPSRTTKKYFHKRGAVAASKLPIFLNDNNECDGGQFYIVSGRIFSEKELTQLENENEHHFSDTQKKYYETIGGAPHLDGEFTVFGEVTSGMEVVDKITKQPVDDFDRPLKNIRISTVKILMKK